MNKYQIEIKQSETFIVDILAKTEAEAKERAIDAYNAGDYQETGDITTDIHNIYDVTNTDDPFDAIN